MGSFLGITADMKFARDYENQIKQAKVEDYISGNIGDKAWQESISSQLQKVDSHHKSIAIILRLFRRESIERRKYKSITRYYKAKQYLSIDIMLDMDKYLDLPEDEVRRLMCDDIFDYVEEMLIKYQKRFDDFDAMAFLPLLKERIAQIKQGVFEDNFYQTERYQSFILAQKFLKEIEDEEG